MKFFFLFLNLFCWGFAEEFSELSQSDIQIYAPERLEDSFEKIKIGDTLKFKLNGPVVEGKSLNRVTVEPRDQEESLIALGWSVVVGDESNPSRIVLNVTPLKGSLNQLPALLLKDDSGAVFASMDSLRLDVEPFESEKEVKEFLPPVSVRFPYEWVIGIFVIVLLVVFVLIYFLIRKSKKKHKLEQVKPTPQITVPEDVAALSLLSEVELKRLVEKKRHKEHYFSVSDILKEYLGKRYGFDAIESTTSELLQFLRQNCQEKNVIELVTQIFEKLDFVKFTDEVPTVDDGTALVNEARKLIELSKKRNG